MPTEKKGERNGRVRKKTSNPRQRIGRSSERWETELDSSGKVARAALAFKVFPVIPSSSMIRSNGIGRGLRRSRMSVAFHFHLDAMR